MDLLAKSIAQTHIHNGCITIRGIRVCTNLQRTLYQSIHHQDMVYFLANHLSIDEQRVHTDLAWHSFRKTRKEFNLDVVENDGQLFIGPVFFFHLIWIHRNAALHESEAHHNNRGATHLPSVITSEHSRGLDSLHRVHAPYFRIPLADLLNRQISYQKQWFL
jgi:hypothetical protein